VHTRPTRGTFNILRCNYKEDVHEYDYYIVVHLHKLTDYSSRLISTRKLVENGYYDINN
jgi:hypothetical protein